MTCWEFCLLTQFYSHQEVSDFPGPFATPMVMLISVLLKMPTSERLVWFWALDKGERSIIHRHAPSNSLPKTLSWIWKHCHPEHILLNILCKQFPQLLLFFSSRILRSSYTHQQQCLYFYRGQQHSMLPSCKGTFLYRNEYLQKCNSTLNAP